MKPITTDLITFGFIKLILMHKLIVFLRPFAKYILAAWLLTMVALSSTPDLPTLKLRTSGSEIRLDYFIHFCEYGLLAFLAFLSSVNKNLAMSLKKYTFITLALSLFAFIDEYHQIFIPGRTVNIKDTISNLTGIFTALIFCLLFFRKSSNGFIKNSGGTDEKFI
jgi:VanZ family protein